MKNKKTKIAILGVIALILVTIGITYAYWLVTKTQTGKNEITAGCLDIAISNEANDISLTDQFPLSDEEGMKLVPYEFTVTNNCNTSVDYHINLEVLEAGDEIGSDSIKSVLNEETPKKLYDYVGTDTTISNAYEAYILGYGTLSTSGSEGSSATYKLRLWIDADAPISENNKTFESKISVTIGQGISSQGNTLASLILEDAETNGYLKTETPVFKTATVASEYGIYSAEDNYGTSYYFRGDVENNYVKLGTWNETVTEGIRGCWGIGALDSCTGKTYETMEACEAAMDTDFHSWCHEVIYANENDPMYWRIVRINGDGTIRLVYDGTSAIANSEKHTAIIGKTVFNEKSNDAKYVGYTYDDGTGTQVDSIIKGVLETWYENNLEASHGKYIADEAFCNDRSEGSSNDNYSSSSSTNIYYGAYERLSDFNGANIALTPTLKCVHSEDEYTVSEAKGNGLLNKPVGLLTADEAVFSGYDGNHQSLTGSCSNENYLCSSTFYEYLMSPSHLYAPSYKTSNIWAIWGETSITPNATSMSNGARPVINLKADVKFTGDGTIDNPYKIVTE